MQSWATQVFNSEEKRYSVNSENPNEINWLLDSGCSDHIINDCKFFDEYVNLKEPLDVKLPNGKTVKATKVGNVKTYFKAYHYENEINIKNAYYVKDINQNLLSFSKITKTSYTIIAKNDNPKIYNENRKLLAAADKVGNLYRMKSFVTKNDKTKVYTNVTMLTDKAKWHRALGHVNFQYLNRLVKNKLLDGLPDKIENTEMKCANCIESKMSNEPFENDRTKTTEFLELIHTDLNGPHNTTGYGGEKYFVTFIDDYSKCARIYCIKSKAETASCFIDYVNLVENQFNKKVKKLHCDNGKEYMNKEIFNFIKYKGIQMLPCPPCVHALNGVAERYNRSAMDIGRCLMGEAKINRKFWPEVMSTVAYLKNRTIANTAENKSPYEIFFGKKPNVKNLKIYGSRVFVRVPEVLRKSKWDKKAELGVLVGYTNNGYRVLLNNRVINARHVTVVEENTQLICLEKTEAQKDKEYESELEEREGEVNNEYENNTNIDDENENVNEPQNLSVQRKSNRKKSPVNRYGNPVTHFIYVNYMNVNVPNTFEDALNCNESQEWQKAMNSEIESLKKNDTWQIVEKPKDKKIICRCKMGLQEKE